MVSRKRKMAPAPILYCASFTIDCQERHQTVRAGVGSIPLLAGQTRTIPRDMNLVSNAESRQ